MCEDGTFRDSRPENVLLCGSPFRRDYEGRLRWVKVQEPVEGEKLS